VSPAEVKMKNRIFLLALMVISLVHYGSGLSGDAFCAGNTRIISDMDDMRLEIPANPVNIACLHCVSPERIMILGEGARISFMSPQSPWAYKLFPEINRAETRKRRSPEQMKADGVDLALFSPGMDNGKKLRDAGLNTVCAFSALKRPMNIDQFKDNFKRQITMFGDILGPKAQARARRYNEYFQKKVNEILAITSRINKKDRPRVWYGGRGGSMMNTQGFGSVMHWEAEIAGADFLPARLKENYDKATMEQIRSWDPEFVFLSGYCESSDMVTKN
jgi:iron complex transport system substrate-binding protein